MSFDLKGGGGRAPQKTFRPICCVDALNKIDGLIHLPPIRAEEPVASLRAALSEVRGYAHITHYRLVLDQNNLNAALHTPLPVDNIDTDFDARLSLTSNSTLGDNNDSMNACQATWPATTA